MKQSNGSFKRLGDDRIALFLHVGVHGGCMKVDFDRLQSCAPIQKGAGDCAGSCQGDVDLLNPQNVDSNGSLEYKRKNYGLYFSNFFDMTTLVDGERSKG